MKALTGKDWTRLWSEFAVWHDAQTPRCDCCGGRDYSRGGGDWEDQQNKIEELVEEYLQNKFDFE